MKKVLLYSGGLDSWLIDKLWEPDIRLYIDTNSLGSKAEIKKLPEDVIVEKLDISKFEIPERNYILPLRNLYFCMMGMMYGDTICLGATASSTNLDKTPQFCSLASALLSYLSPQVYVTHKDIQVVIPYKNYSKAQLLKSYKDNGGDLDVAFYSTSSCYNPREDGKPCYKCTSCLKKLEAFRENGYEFKE